MEKERKAFEEWDKHSENYQDETFAYNMCEVENVSSNNERFWGFQCFYGGFHSRDEEIEALKAQMQRKDALLKDVKLTLEIVKPQKYFYKGQNICRFCGTIDNSHHSARCIVTAYNQIEQALSEEKENER